MEVVGFCSLVSTLFIIVTRLAFDLVFSKLFDRKKEFLKPLLVVHGRKVRHLQLLV